MFPCMYLCGQYLKKIFYKPSPNKYDHLQGLRERLNSLQEDVSLVDLSTFEKMKYAVLPVENFRTKDIAEIVKMLQIMQEHNVGFLGFYTYCL